MKKIIFAVIILLTLLLFSTNNSQAITIGFDPITQDVLLSNPADVNVVISGLGDFTAPSLGAFDLDIIYDPTILSMTGVTFGDQFGYLGFGRESYRCFHCRSWCGKYF
jgi:hypothetical protein